MPTILATKASNEPDGRIKVLYRYDDETVRTVYLDPLTKDREDAGLSEPRRNANGTVATCWWR